MSAPEVVFLSLLAGGISSLLAGLLLTRFHWRPDLPPYGRGTRLLDVALHPETYAQDAPFLTIRSLTVAGALLLVGAVIIVGYEIIRTTLGP